MQDLFFFEIIGHDVMGFDMEVLLHRTILNKIPNWSRLGRLKRSQPLKGRMSERIATTGRLVCDLKISAKELIRCKSYDLGALIEKLLGKPQESRMEVDVEMMRKAYGSSKALIEVTSHCLQDAADTLKVMFRCIGNSLYLKKVSFLCIIHLTKNLIQCFPMNIPTDMSSLDVYAKCPRSLVQFSLGYFLYKVRQYF